jgi:formylglycine-generating enzyme required for sulfatase activity
LPLSAFAHALRAFCSGDLTHDELAWEIDHQLAIEKASPVALLEVLKIQQGEQPLPSGAYEALVQHLEQWPKDPTIVTGPSRRQRREPAPSVAVGDVLQGRFSLVALIGEGGMSRVFKAIDLRRAEAGAADPYVAVKVLTEPFSEYFGSIVALQRETRKLQSLTHPNIVRVIDCDHDAKTVFMTMEYLAGESLQKKLRAPGGAGFSDAAATAIVNTIGHALEYAHRNHVVHGDLKPGNIILTDLGVVKIIDFGMARFIAHPDEPPPEPPGKTMPTAVTPRYASPEMVAGHDPEPADDVYALACIAFETLSGTHPFGWHSDPRARDPHSQPPRPVGMRRQHYAALIKALAFDRRQRTPSVRQFLAEFQTPPLDWLRARRAWLGLLAIALISVAAYRLSSPHKRPVTRRLDTPVIAPGMVVQDCATCPSMTVLPPGRLMQGGDAPSTSSFEKPRHLVVIGHALAMSTMEVTVGEFREFATATRRELAGCTVYDGHWQYQKSASWQAPGFIQNSTHPVTCVSWDDAVAYAAWLSAAGGHHYRLPSASEWEYAARAGADLAQPWGADTAKACTVANVADQSAERRFHGWSVFACDDHYVNTAPVGSFKANAFGVHDLLGNVFEWVQDCWHDDYVGAPTDGSARIDVACDEHELRGGSWFTSPEFVGAGYRDRFAGAYRSSAVGFRVVRDLNE